MVNASPPTLPWSTSLPPSVPTSLLTFYGHHLSLYTSLRQFIEARAQLEREYATKLRGLVGKLREKELKDRKVVLLTVGEDSERGWEEGLENQNTFLSSLNSHLTHLLAISTSHSKLADDLQSQVIDEFKRSGDKKEAVRRKVGEWVESMGEEEEGARVGCEKAMAKYHQSHADLTTAQSKHSKAPRDDRHLPRLLKTYRSALTENHLAKNEYVLSLAVASRAQEVYHDRDADWRDRNGVEGEGGEFGPGVARVQDHMQELYISSVERLNELMAHSSRVYADFYITQSQHSGAITKLHAEKVDAGRDADLYASWNMRSSEANPSAVIVKPVWQPCPGLKSTEVDTPTLTLGKDASLAFDEPTGHAGLGHPTTLGPAPELTVLQSRLASNLTQRDHLRGTISSLWEEVDKGRRVVREWEGNRGLGDPDEVREGLGGSWRELGVGEWRAEMLEAEIRVLEETLGSETGAQRPHDYEKSTFALPLPCDHCSSSIWGMTKPGMTCKKCGSNVHVKCSNRVAAECTNYSAASSPQPISSNKRSSFFPRRDNSPSASVTDLIATAANGAHSSAHGHNHSHGHGRDDSSSSLSAIRNVLSSGRRKSSEVNSVTTPSYDQSILPAPHKMTDWMETNSMVHMPSVAPTANGNGAGHNNTPPPARDNRRRSMFGTSRRKSTDPNGSQGYFVANPSAPSPVGTPKIEEEVGRSGLGPSRAVPIQAAQANGGRNAGRGLPTPPIMTNVVNGIGRDERPVVMAKMLFDFEAGDTDEVGVEKDRIVQVLQPDDGYGWLKVRLGPEQGGLEGLVPASYAEIIKQAPTAPKAQSPIASSPQRILSPQQQAGGGFMQTPVAHQPFSSPSHSNHATSPSSLPNGFVPPPQSSWGAMPRARTVVPTMPSLLAPGSSPAVPTQAQSPPHQLMHPPPLTRPNTVPVVQQTMPGAMPLPVAVDPFRDTQRPFAAHVPGKHGQVRALFTYTAAASDEFGVVKGQVYDLSPRGRNYDSGWWELMDSTGRTGITPANYIQPI